MLRLSGLFHFPRVVLRTHGHDEYVSKGLQWVLHNARDGQDELRTLVNTKIIHKGIMEVHSKLLSSIIYKYQIS